MELKSADMDLGVDRKDLPPSQMEPLHSDTSDLKKMNLWPKPPKRNAKVLLQFKETCIQTGIEVFSTEEMMKEFGESDVFRLGNG